MRARFNALVFSTRVQRPSVASRPPTGRTPVTAIGKPKKVQGSTIFEYWRRFRRGLSPRALVISDCRLIRARQFGTKGRSQSSGITGPTALRRQS